jgi:hypothetical protein
VGHGNGAHWLSKRIFSLGSTRGLCCFHTFFVTATEIFWGKPLTPLSSPLPFFGYPFLVITFVGWIWTLLRETGSRKLFSERE